MISVAARRVRRNILRSSVLKSPLQLHSSTNPSDEVITSTVLRWVHRWVVGLGLCPWAAAMLVDDKIKVTVYRNQIKNDNDFERVTSFVLDEAWSLIHPSIDESVTATTVSKVETTLIVLPYVTNFEDFLDISDTVENALEEIAMGTVTYRGKCIEGNDVVCSGMWADSVQVATFHPDYQFADAVDDDVTNYTNRSPYAIIHLLKAADVERAIKEMDNETEKVWQRNKMKMEMMGKEQIEKLLLQISGKK